MRRRTHTEPYKETKKTDESSSAVMNKEEIGEKAKEALAAAGNMASQGAEWLKGRDWKGYGEKARDLAADVKQRIYGKPGDDPPSNKGFVTFSAFRFLVTPALVKILWFVGAYIVYPVTMYNILDAMNEYRGFVGGGTYWKVIAISILCLVTFRLLLELFMHVSKMYYSSKRTVELLEELVAIEQKRSGREAGESGNGADTGAAEGSDA